MSVAIKRIVSGSDSRGVRDPTVVGTTTVGGVACWVHGGRVRLSAGVSLSGTRPSISAGDNGLTAHAVRHVIETRSGGTRDLFRRTEIPDTEQTNVRNECPFVRCPDRLKRTGPGVVDPTTVVRYRLRAAVVPPTPRATRFTGARTSTIAGRGRVRATRACKYCTRSRPRFYLSPISLPHAVVSRDKTRSSGETRPRPVCVGYCFHGFCGRTQTVRPRSTVPEFGPLFK